MKATLQHRVSANSLSEFARAHSVALTRFAYLLCGDRGLAEDLVQDAFVALYRRFGDELAIEAPLPYARRTIVDAHISHTRATSSTALGDPPERPVEDVGNPRQDAMWQTLATLPERQRAVLVLRYTSTSATSTSPPRSTAAKAPCAAWPPARSRRCAQIPS